MSWATANCSHNLRFLQCPTLRKCPIFDLCFPSWKATAVYWICLRIRFEDWLSEGNGSTSSMPQYPFFFRTQGSQYPTQRTWWCQACCLQRWLTHFPLRLGYLPSVPCFLSPLKQATQTHTFVLGFAAEGPQYKGLTSQLLTFSMLEWPAPIVKKYLTVSLGDNLLFGSRGIQLVLIWQSPLIQWWYNPRPSADAWNCRNILLWMRLGYPLGSIVIGDFACKVALLGNSKILKS